MSRTVLQIPMSKTLRNKAEKTALDLGFSSLQETVRIFLNKLASKTIEITFKEKGAVQLSPRAIARYNKIIDDIEKGKNITSTENLSELFSLLK